MLAPFFIVGVGRSGTSLLMAMLNAHPKIGMTPEVFFLLRYGYRQPLMKVSDLKQQLGEDLQFQRLELKPSLLLEPWSDEEVVATAEVHRRLLSLSAERLQADVMGEKAPKYIEILPLIRHVYPDAKIIHIIRDPRDVFLSRKKASWSSGYSNFAHFLAYQAQLSFGCSQGPKLFGKNYKELKYEDLLVDARGELTALCELLGLGYSSAMENFSASAESLISDTERSWKKETLGPLLTNNKDKWKQQLSLSLTARIESSCSSVFDAGFYDRSNNSSSAVVAVESWAVKVASWSYQKRLAYRNRKAIAAG